MLNVKERTKKEILSYLEEKEGKIYEKQEGSAYQGYLKEWYDEESGRTYLIDIRMTDLDMVIYRVLPGIHVADKAYIPAVAKYFQDLECELGILSVSRDYPDVVYRTQMCMKEVAITKVALEIVEEEAIGIFRKHFVNIEKLAHGKMVGILRRRRKSQKPKKVESVSYDKKGNYEKLEEYLTKISRHNEVCKNLNEKSECVYSCQVVAERNRFRLQYNLTDNGFLVIKAFHGEKGLVIREEYKYGVADCMNDKNARYDYGSLHIGDEKDGVYCCIHTPIHGGVIGVETIRIMERIVLLILNEVIGAIEHLSVGIMPRIREEVVEAIVSEALTYVKRPGMRAAEGKKIVNIADVIGK